jgi:hypothetical protein
VSDWKVPWLKEQLPKHTISKPVAASTERRRAAVQKDRMYDGFM